MHVHPKCMLSYSTYLYIYMYTYVVWKLMFEKLK